MKKGTFQERLAAAINNSDMLIIQRVDGEKSLLFLVESDTEEYGKLAGEARIRLDRATPGQFIRAIEKAKGKITTAIDVMTAAKKKYF